MLVLLVVVVAWVAIGVTTGLVEARHGHWARIWVLDACFGPFAVPLAIVRRRQVTAATRLHAGTPAGGDLDVLVGVDGSGSAVSAARTAAELFGPRLRRLTLATVLDVDTGAVCAGSGPSPEPWAEERAAREVLEAATTAVSQVAGVVPDTMLLTGQPATALEAHAVDHGYDVLVTGCRGRGLAKAVLGSCASRLARCTRVPVVIVPVARPDGPTATARPTTSPKVRPS